MGGSLRIALMMNPVGNWNQKQGDRHLNVEIEPGEWEALFRDEINVPVWNELSNDEDGWNYLERQKQRFEEALSTRGYPMLGRIWEIYRDAAYLSSEVGKLRHESLRLLRTTQNIAAAHALQKIVFACEEAQKMNSGIRLLSD